MNFFVPPSTTSAAAAAPVLAFPSTSTSIVTTAPSTIPVTGTTTGASTSAKPVRTYRDFERLLNKWQSDFDTKHRVAYDDLAQAVRQRDIDLSTYRETLQLIQRDINQMQIQQTHLQDELNLLATHEHELETNIVRLETDIVQLPPLQHYNPSQQSFFGTSVPSTLNERMKNFDLMVQFDSLVKRSTKDLQEIVDRMNEQDDNDDNIGSFGQDFTNSNMDTNTVNEQNVKQLTKTLDSCFKMLAFIDANVNEIESKVTQTNNRLLNS